MPQSNAPWESETADRRELDTLFQELQKTPQYTATTPNRRLEEAQRLLQKAEDEQNDAVASEYRMQIASIQDARRRAEHRSNARFADVDSRIDTLVGPDSNPSALLKTIYLEQSASRDNHIGRRDVAAHLEGKAAEVKDESDDLEVRYIAISRYFANNPTADAKELSDRAKILAELNNRASATAIASGSARRSHEDMARMRDLSAHLPASLLKIAQRIENRYAADWATAEQLTADVTTDLRSWDILGGPRYAGQEDNVRQQLVSLQACIDRLPRHDDMRAEALANYTRLRYRLEERMIHEGNINGAPRTTAEFTANRGILLYEGTANEVVIHDDGSTERPDPETGNWVRRSADGQPWVPQKTELVIDPGADALPVGEAFSAWEENRTPKTAAEAYASLTKHINTEVANETAHSQNISQIDTETASNESLIQRADGAIAENNHVIPTLNAQIAANHAERDTLDANDDRSKQDNKRLAELDALIPQQEAEVKARIEQNANLTQTIADALADNVRLAAQRTAEIAARRRVREALNPARYWHGLLEVNAERTVAEARARGLGRWLARREAERARDSLPAVPTVLADGSLIFDQAVINGRGVPTEAEIAEAREADAPIPSWQIWPDGTASRYDLRRGSFVQYSPNGRVI